MRLNLFFLMVVVAGSGWAEQAPPEPSPRQAYDRAVTLFAQGHEFTAEEQKGLEDLRGQLINSGDSDLAANLDLLRLGSATAARVSDLKKQDVATKELDSDEWDQRLKLARDQDFWRIVRNVGLTTFAASTIVTLLAASINDRDQATLNGNYTSDWSDRKALSDSLNWVVIGSASTMFLSLFPLLWGEARQ